MLANAVGFVLNRKRAGEADITFELLPETGRTLRLRLHGILASRKRSGLVAEPGALIEAVYYQKEDGFGSVKEARVRDRFEECKQNYETMLIVSHLLELCSLAASGDESGQVHQLLLGAMGELRARQPDPRKVAGAQEVRRLLGFFRLRLARILGVLADPQACAECGEALENEAVWLLPELAFACHRCRADVSKEDFRMAQLMVAASRQRYANFADTVPADGPLLATWDRNLLRATEAFLGREVRTAGELYPVMPSSG